MEIKAKIVNAKPPKSKSAQMREIAQTIVGNPERAVFLDNFNDVHQFGKILRGLIFPQKKRIEICKLEINRY